MASPLSLMNFALPPRSSIQIVSPVESRKHGDFPLLVEGEPGLRKRYADQPDPPYVSANNWQEAYLLRTRLHKMPYKHIATHLRKTELACRLHYHQMSYGSNRRRRTESMSSSVSSCGA